MQHQGCLHGGGSFIPWAAVTHCTPRSCIAAGAPTTPSPTLCFLLGSTGPKQCAGGALSTPCCLLWPPGHHHCSRTVLCRPGCCNSPCGAGHLEEVSHFRALAACTWHQACACSMQQLVSRCVCWCLLSVGAGDVVCTRRRLGHNIVAGLLISRIGGGVWVCLHPTRPGCVVVVRFVACVETCPYTT
jgi:hypothetical protein